MKALAKLVAVLVVLGFCLPSYGEILVYKFVDTSTCYELEGGQWDVWKETNRGYIVLDVDYAGDDCTIEQAEAISYWKDQDGKQFKQGPLDLELVRVEYKGNKVEWVIMEKALAPVGDPPEIIGEFTMLTGNAVKRPVGIGTGPGDKREVPNKLSGSALEDEIDDGWRYIDVSKLTLTLFPSWTYWANGDGEDEGKQGFDATKQMIKNDLIKKGYTEEIP